MGDHYLERTRGYIVSSVTGQHVFSIAGDDQCELWFGTQPNVQQATLIASVTSSSG